MRIITCILLLLAAYPTCSQNVFRPGDIWPDDRGRHINAHGGGILYHEGRYYWFGEHKGERSNAALVGVTCYSSGNLYDWRYEGVVLPVDTTDELSDITRGSVIERPKVIYNAKTRQFVMYFHLELKDKGYTAARVGVAVSDKPVGEYRYLKSYRPNAGIFPENMTESQRTATAKIEDFPEWWTPQWRTAVVDGMFVRRDLAGGQMSRDMTLYVDDDGKAYHIYASEENLTLHLAELSDDYLSHTGRYVRIAPGGHNEAPAIFKKDGRYYLITSGCTGWDPNAARLFTADNIRGPWTEHPNPCVGDDAGLTFHSQSTYILPVQGRNDAFIFMADRWTPHNPIDGRYVWLPVRFENGLPVLKWQDEWDLNVFDGYTLVWNEEFDYEGQPDTAIWRHEQGFVRNQELQYYQPANAVVGNGLLTITAKKEHTPNPAYTPGSGDWRKNREFAQYTSSCIKTVGSKEFQYGRFTIRARIPTASGSWPAIWTLGKSMPWPSNGEIDIMEYYRIENVPHILANTAWGTDRPGSARWNTKTVPFSRFTDRDPRWAEQFHIWRMDWDEIAIRLYLDDELLNETLLRDVRNGSAGEYKNPFHQPHYLLLNLATGGQNGGLPDDDAFPLKYEIDYVRVYQKITVRKDVPLDSIRLSDPCILADKKTSMYYMTGTGGMLWKSKDLKLWDGPYRVAMTDSASWMGPNPMIWAAELHQYEGKYYYFATFTNRAVKIDTVRGNAIERRACHILVSDRPDGLYLPMCDSVYLPPGKPTLDGTFWVDKDGKPYMVYCYEWLQNWNGTIEKIELKPDLSGSTGEGKVLFRASDSPWSKEKDEDRREVPNKVTDGPYLFYTQTGRLGMIWTSWSYSDYMQGVAYSESGTLDGPWIHEKDPVTPPNYGHGMLFRTLEGKLLMSVHSHENVNGRYVRIPCLFEVDDSGDKLIIGKPY